MSKPGAQIRNLYTQVKSSEKKTEHIVVAIVQDTPEVFSRIAGLMRRRSFSLKSLTIGKSEQLGYLRMTMVVDATRTDTEQVIKQLYKIIEVTKVTDISFASNIQRELALIKIFATKLTRSEIMQIVDIFRAKIVDVGHDSLMVEITGDTTKINSFLDLVRSFGIKELARTGATAMSRGAN
jgi:acetolactate synthase-1/3 small subunit